MINNMSLQHTSWLHWTISWLSWLFRSYVGHGVISVELNCITKIAGWTSEGLPDSFLVPTVDSTDCEGVVCPQDQSRTGVVLTGTHLLTRTGGGVRGDYHTIPLHISIACWEVKEGDHWRETTGSPWRSRRGGGGGEGKTTYQSRVILTRLNAILSLPRMRVVVVLVLSEDKHSINCDSLKSDTFSVDTTSMLLSLIRVALKMLTVALGRGGAKLRGICSVLSIGL